MRKLGLIAATAVASISVAGVAQAIDVSTVNQGVSVKVTGKKGTKAKPAGVALNVTTTTSAKDSSKNGTYATTLAVIRFDKNLKFNNSKFPTCDLQTVATSPEDCPKGSLVGTGKATAIVGAQQIKANPTIQAFNGPDGTLQLKLIKAAGEVDSSGVLTGTLKSDTGKYGKKLNVPIPPKLQNQLGLYVTLTSFNTKISSKKYKGVSYATSSGCTGGKYKFGGDFSFIDGPYNPQTDGTYPSSKLTKTGPLKVTSTANC